MAEQRNIPELRFLDFNQPWESLNFGLVYKFYSTNSFSRDQLNFQSGLVKNIHYGDVHTKFQASFDTHREEVPFINSDVSLLRIKEESYCLEGDLVIADASEDYEDIGKSLEIIHLNGERMLAGLHTFLARPDKSKITKGYGGFLMKSPSLRKQIKIIAQGTKVLGISTGRLSGTKIHLPSLPEQQKIASFLTVVDERLTALKKKKELLEKYKKGVMQKLFPSTGSGQVPEIRFKIENEHGELVDAPDWEEKKLGEITKIYDGTHQTPNYQMTGIPFFSVEHLTSNNFSDTKFISKKIFDKENKRVRIENGDILMTRIGDIGTSKYIDWDVEASFYVSLALIKKDPNFNSEYLNHFIRTDSFQRELWKRTIHVAFPKKINLGEIGNCLVLLPSPDEQEKIAAFLTTIHNKITHCQSQIDKTAEWKKGLLQKMFV